MKRIGHTWHNRATHSVSDQGPERSDRPRRLPPHRQLGICWQEPQAADRSASLIATRPFTVPCSVVATRSTATDVAGSTRPRAPTISTRVSMTTTGSGSPPASPPRRHCRGMAASTLSNRCSASRINPSGVNAARQRRRSPGATMSRSPEPPDEPPSSATETRRPATRHDRPSTRARSTAVPTPDGDNRRARHLSMSVIVGACRLVERLGHLFRDGDRPMTTPHSATECNGQVRLPLLHIERKDQCQQSFEARQERTVTGCSNT